MGLCESKMEMITPGVPSGIGVGSNHFRVRGITKASRWGGNGILRKHFWNVNNRNGQVQGTRALQLGWSKRLGTWRNIRNRSHSFNMMLYRIDHSRPSLVA